MRRGRTASVLAPFLSCRQYFFEADLQSSFSKLADTRERSIDFFLPAVYLRDYPRYGAAMSCNNERLSTLDVIEQLRHAGFRIGSLNFAHRNLSRLVDLTSHILNIGKYL